jgi:hypothetical protein
LNRATALLLYASLSSSSFFQQGTNDLGSDLAILRRYSTPPSALNSFDDGLAPIRGDLVAHAALPTGPERSRLACLKIYFSIMGILAGALA